MEVDLLSSEIQNTTTAGVGYAALCKGSTQGYSFFCTQTSVSTHTFLGTAHSLVSRVLLILDQLEQGTGRKIEEFVIGKSSVRKKRRQAFDARRVSTWRVANIGSRWHSYRENHFSGLVVFTMLQRVDVPAKGPTIFHDQEMLTLAMEQQLVHRFAYEVQDPRLGNKTLEEGKRAKNACVGHVLYVAFRFAKATLSPLEPGKRIGTSTAADPVQKHDQVVRDADGDADADADAGRMTGQGKAEN